jgi:hypothetical protein
MDVSGLYRLNNFDFYDTFGFVVESGTDDFLKFPTRNEPYSKKWAEQNVKEYDLSHPFFEDAPATFTGAIVADNEADFWNKYYSFWGLLKSPGSLTLYINEFETNFLVFYKSMNTVKRVTRIKGASQVVVRVEITFQIITPVFGGGAVPEYPYHYMLTSTVNTFAELTALPAPAAATHYRVKQDEDKGQANTNYFVYPDGVREWIAAVQDN